MSTVSGTIRQPDDINQLLALMMQSDQELDDLFTRLENSYESALEPGMKRQDRLNAVIDSQYIITTLRVKICFEHMKIKRILTLYNDKTTSPVVIGKFKNRDTHLTTLIIRLNELTKDSEVLQKLTYTQSNIFKY